MPEKKPVSISHSDLEYLFAVHIHFSDQKYYFFRQNSNKYSIRILDSMHAFFIFKKNTTTTYFYVCIYSLPTILFYPPSDIMLYLLTPSSKLHDIFR